MPSLVLRNIPPHLHQRLKVTAAAHRRSMNQEAIIALEAGLGLAERSPGTPTLEESLNWLRDEVWSLPIEDQRSPDDILGYDGDGLCN